MQELLAELLWKNEEIDEAAIHLCEALPGYHEAEQQFCETAQRLREAVGSELYNQFYNCFMRYTGYEVQAYYSLGLGLRKELAQALGL